MFGIAQSSPVPTCRGVRAELRAYPTQKIRFCEGVLLALVICALPAGCASDKADRYYANERYPARPEKDVEILHDVPNRPYDVIADFQARGASPDYMRKRAAEIGADAVIVGMYGGYRAKSDTWASEDEHRDSYSRITGTAIRYKQRDEK